MGNEWHRPGLALALDSLPEAEVSKRVTCEHGSRGLRGRGSLGGSTFGRKHLRAHNHLRGTSWDWRQGLIAQAFSAPIVTSPAQGRGFLWVPQPLRRSGWPWWADEKWVWSWRPQTQVLVEVLWWDVLKTTESRMNLVTQMALKGTRTSEVRERQVRLKLKPQSRCRHLTL